MSTSYVPLKYLYFVEIGMLKIVWSLLRYIKIIQ